MARSETARWVTNKWDGAVCQTCLTQMERGVVVLWLGRKKGSLCEPCGRDHLVVASDTSVYPVEVNGSRR